VASSQQVPVALAAAAREVYTLARLQGRGQEDWTAIYAMIREMALGDSA